MTRRFGESAESLFGVSALILGWRPGEFWDSTPAELSAALRPAGSDPEGPGREVIEQLIRRFPDRDEKDI